MTEYVRFDLNFIEQRVCDVASRLLVIPRNEVRLASRLKEDLRCDSLDEVELIMALVDEFKITFLDDSLTLVGNSVFDRKPFRLSDLAEIVYLQQGTGIPERNG